VTNSFILGSEFSFFSACVIIKLATDSTCTRDLGITGGDKLPLLSAPGCTELVEASCVAART